MPTASERTPELEAVLDAAAACYLQFGVQKTTAADIAKRAGMSRATFYRRYGSHEAIFLELLTRESEAMARDSEAHLAGIADPSEQLVEGMLFAIDQIRHRPVHAAVFTSDSAGWAVTQALSVDALRRLGEAGIRPMLGPSQPEGAEATRAMADLVDYMLRVLISYAVVPGRGGLDTADIRRQLTTLFLPAFEQMLAGLER